MIGTHKFFKEDIKEMDKLKKDLIEIEECFINAMEIKNLFNENAGDIKFKIGELQNAAKIAKSILELSEKEHMILSVIIHSSKIKVIALLDEWFHHIKSIFASLPSDEDLLHVATQTVERYKTAKENENEIENVTGNES